MVTMAFKLRVCQLCAEAHVTGPLAEGLRQLHTELTKVKEFCFRLGTQTKHTYQFQAEGTH